MENKAKVKRSPKRGIYNREEVYKILDKHFMCHVAFVHNGIPFSIPTMYGRDGDVLYLHGASVSRLMLELEKGEDVCISVAGVNDLVLARSAFHHSLNYESVVIFGKGKLVSEEKKEMALKVISDHLILGRWDEVRAPNEKELKATKVVAVSMDEVSGKARYGGPNDEKEDYELDVWAGTVSVQKKLGTPVTDPNSRKEVAISKSVLDYERKHKL